MCFPSFCQGQGVLLTFAEEMRLNQEQQKKAHRRSRKRPRHTKMLHLSDDLMRLQQHIHPDSTRNKHSLILRKHGLLGKDTFHAEKPLLICVETACATGFYSERLKFNTSFNAASDTSCPINRCIVSRSLVVP